MECFTLNSSVNKKFEFNYLKWLINNVNYIIKLEIDLYISESVRTSEDQTSNERSLIDADFVRQNCLPDQIIHLKYFHFYIRGKGRLLQNHREQIVHSFQNHRLFLDHQWTNIEYFFDKNDNIPCEHIFSSNHPRFQLYDVFM